MARMRMPFKKKQKGATLDPFARYRKSQMRYSSIKRPEKLGRVTLTYKNPDLSEYQKFEKFRTRQSQAARNATIGRLRRLKGKIQKAINEQRYGKTATPKIRIE